MSALPKSVQKKVDQANAAYEELYGEIDTGEEPANEGEAAAKPDTAAEATDTSADQSAETSEEAVDKDTSTTAQSESEAPESGITAPEGTTEEAADEGNWEQKYKSLNGKYVAEVPRLHKQIKDLSGQVSSLQATLSALEAKPADSAEAAEAVTKLLKDDEVTEYGEELIDVVKRAAREELAPEVTRLSSENAELKRQLSAFNEGNARTAKQLVYDTLNDRVPNWEQLNSDQGFLQWLDTLDAYTNRLRRDLLSEAFEANDAARVVVFFDGYLKEHAAVSTQQEGTPATRKAQVDMSTLAAPGKPKGGAAPGTQEGQQTWRQSEISAFYADVRKGKFRNNPAEKARIEKSIIAAVNSNRIVA